MDTEAELDRTVLGRPGEAGATDDPALSACDDGPGAVPGLGGLLDDPARIAPEQLGELLVRPPLGDRRPDQARRSDGVIERAEELAAERNDVEALCLES